MTQQTTPDKIKFLDKLKNLKNYNEEIKWIFRVSMFIGILYLIISPLTLNKTIYSSYPHNSSDSSKYVNQYNIFILKQENDSLNSQKLQIKSDINSYNDSTLIFYISDFIREENK